MNHWLLVVIISVLYGCSGEKRNENSPHAIEVVNYNPALQKTDHGWLYKGQPFSGYMIEKEKDNRIVYRLPIINGHENGLAKGWYNTGEKLLERPFIGGKKEGIFTQWWPNSRLRYRFQYRQDAYDGPQLVFFPSGRKREESNYRLGEKEGRQYVWDEAGQLISNYIIRNKKLYGIVSVKSCLPVTH